MARVGTYVPRRSGKVHEVAHCQECSWYNENYKNAMATGAVHARKTGHAVTVEQGTVVWFNPKD